MARKYHNHTLHTNLLHRVEETHSTNSPMTIKAILSNHISLSLSLSLSLFPSEMIAKLEMTLSNAQQKQGPNTKIKHKQ